MCNFPKIFTFESLNECEKNTASRAFQPFRPTSPTHPDFPLKHGQPIKIESRKLSFRGGAIFTFPYLILNKKIWQPTAITGVLILRTPPPYRKTHLETFGEFLWIIKTHIRKLRAQREKFWGFWGIYKGKTLKKRVKKYGKNKNPPKHLARLCEE